MDSIRREVIAYMQSTLITVPDVLLMDVGDIFPI